MSVLFFRFFAYSGMPLAIILFKFNQVCGNFFQYSLNSYEGLIWLVACGVISWVCFIASTVWAWNHVVIVIN
jgi:hypothetical protein